MIFEKDGSVVTLDSPAEYPYGVDYELMQARDRSASGIPHVEDFKVQSTTHKYVFSDLSQSDYVKIMEWHINTAKGMLNSFNLTDDLGVTREVSFTTAKISFSANSFNLWNGSFIVEEVS